MANYFSEIIDNTILRSSALVKLAQSNQFVNFHLQTQFYSQRARNVVSKFSFQRRSQKKKKIEKKVWTVTKQAFVESLQEFCILHAALCRE